MTQDVEAALPCSDATQTLIDHDLSTIVPTGPRRLATQSGNVPESDVKFTQNRSRGFPLEDGVTIPWVESPLVRLASSLFQSAPSKGRTQDFESMSKDHSHHPVSAGAMYAGHFGLKERPFTLLPDPDFIYWSPQHKRAYSVLEIGLLSRAPITLITGAVGSGKTTLLRRLLEHVDDELTVGLISNAQGGRGELMRWTLNAFGVPIPDQNADYVQLFQTFVDFLLDEYSQGRRVVLIIDEAQNLSAEGLEELRMLTNVNSNKDELVQLVLVGQPELRAMVLEHGLRQLAQRVAASFHLERMSAKAVQDYIQHRLRRAGGTGSEITPDAVERIYLHTSGTPRLINQLADLSMMYAWTDDATVVTSETVESVIRDGVFFGAQLAKTSEQD
ncbi:MAG: AAA family ATPase [Pseudomonadota bacterium]|nr:AAA family ATPase [Pseudomonadota bacterium]